MSWFPKKKIVVPYDFSDESFAAIEIAMKLVESPSDLFVVHVLPEIGAAEPGVVWDTVTDESRTSHALEAMAKRLEAPEFKEVNLDTVIGSAANEIAKFAEANEAELIVIPSHGRTGMSRFLMGSVAERVVRLAHCPVLVLRK